MNSFEDARVRGVFPLYRSDKNSMQALPDKMLAKPSCDLIEDSLVITLSKIAGVNFSILEPGNDLDLQ